MRGRKERHEREKGKKGGGRKERNERGRKERNEREKGKKGEGERKERRGRKERNEREKEEKRKRKEAGGTKEVESGEVGVCVWVSLPLFLDGFCFLQLLLPSHV